MIGAAMECFMCGTMVDKEEVCPHCGSNIQVYRRILASSELLYNRGLEQAQVRELSGAIISLKDSLKYNKYNTKARNLLGLIYFEMGETVPALSEWVISKNLEPENPLADEYLDKIQNTSGMLERLNQTTKKYNQALLYCQQGSRDMAIIQLRKVLGMNNKFVAGHQLLALLYMQDGKYDDARKELNVAGRIDVRNTITLRYSKEVREKLKEQNANKKKKSKNDLVAFQDGNDTIVMPNNSFRDMLSNSRASISNILVGLVLGVLVCVFLIVPTVKQRAAENAAATLVETNEELSNSATNATSLKKQVESLQEQLEQYTGKADAIESYEKLMEAEDAYNAGDITLAGDALATVNRDLLSTRGQQIYDTIHTTVYAQILSDAYQAGYSAFQSGDYTTAKEQLGAAVLIDETYENGKALFYLAEAQWNLWEFEDAIANYQKVVDAYPDTSQATTAQERIETYQQATATTD
jgi:tetratricopeptide (TPR) repeat protein